MPAMTVLLGYGDRNDAAFAGLVAGGCAEAIDSSIAHTVTRRVKTPPSTPVRGAAGEAFEDDDFKVQQPAASLDRLFARVCDMPRGWQKEP
jgi:hypothetical protein